MKIKNHPACVCCYHVIGPHSINVKNHILLSQKHGGLCLMVCCKCWTVFDDKVKDLDYPSESKIKLH